jgi:tetratricopeptide (TPR) repeat protein
MGWRLVNKGIFRNRVAATLVILGAMVPVAARAQSPAKPAAGGIDSNAVANLFYSAIREKTVENNNQAVDLFNKILAIDPSNDASLYELANIKKRQNKYTEAQPLLEKAVTVKPNNEWYWASLAEIYEKSNDVGKL